MFKGGNSARTKARFFGYFLSRRKESSIPLGGAHGSFARFLKAWHHPCSSNKNTVLPRTAEKRHTEQRIAKHAVLDTVRNTYAFHAETSLCQGSDTILMDEDIILHFDRFVNRIVINF